MQYLGTHSLQIAKDPFEAVQPRVVVEKLFNHLYSMAVLYFLLMLAIVNGVLACRFVVVLTQYAYKHICHQFRGIALSHTGG